MRGTVNNEDRLMKQEDVADFLHKGQIAHVGTVDQDGYPYVIPLMYTYDGENKIYLHNGNIRESHFVENIKTNSKVSIEVTEMGDIHPGRKYACNSALVYTSAVAFGTISQIDADEEKVKFFDDLWEKYGDPDWEFQKGGYPLTGKIDLFVVDIEKVTGKHNAGKKH